MRLFDGGYENFHSSKGVGFCTMANFFGGLASQCTKSVPLTTFLTRVYPVFPGECYELGEFDDPDAILVRSHQLTPEDAGDNLVAVGRAGAGVNNIPVSEYTQKGIVVFNTPGANANAVKELVMAGLLLSCRGIIPGIEYVNTLGDHSDKGELNKLVEASKKQYKGHELKGRTLGILGLGAIGSMVADMALQMDMDVLGYDPALSVDAAWRLSSRVEKMDSMQALFAKADIVSLHVPALDTTRGMINDEALSYFRDGAVLLNFAREEIVDKEAITAALDSGKVAQYISDFPSPGLIGKPGVISTPHLGASTEEAEENCAMMVADQVRDFLEHGNIRNSVNFRPCRLSEPKTLIALRSPTTTYRESSGVSCRSLPTGTSTWWTCSTSHAMKLPII